MGPGQGSREERLVMKQCLLPCPLLCYFPYMTQLPSPLWWHTGDVPFRSWVTATNTCTGSLQATRALQPCKCSWGSPVADCSLPWMTSAPPGSLTFHSSPGPEVSLSKTQLQSRTVLFIILSDSPRSLHWPRHHMGHSLPCCPGSGRHSLYCS